MAELFRCPAVHFPENKGDRYVQHRLVGWRRRHRHRRLESRRFCLSLQAVRRFDTKIEKERNMNSIIWLVGAVVIVLAILSFVGLG